MQHFLPSNNRFQKLPDSVTTQGKSPLMAKMLKKKILKAIKKEDLDQINFAIRAREVLKRNNYGAEEIKEFVKSIDK